MEADILKTAGQVAGIGGVALGVFLVLFRDIIRKNIFPRLPTAEAFHLLRLIAVLVFVVALAGIGAWVYVETDSGVLAADGSSYPSGRDINVGRIEID
jgi:hypothetical protein